MNAKVIELSSILGLSFEKTRNTLYFLQRRYGKRKGVKRLLKIAALEVAAIQAKKELQEAEQ